MDLLSWIRFNYRMAVAMVIISHKAIRGLMQREKKKIESNEIIFSGHVSGMS